MMLSMNNCTPIFYRKICFFLITIFNIFICANTFASESQPIKIVFLGESSAKDPVWAYRAKRMEQTAKGLPNVEFKYRFAEGNYKYHSQMIEEEVNAGANAIIGPWWDPIIYNDAITNAVKNGVFVYGLLGIGPKHSLPPEILNKMGGIETNWEEYGERLAKISLSSVQQGGKILWPAEIATSPYITDAIVGFKKVYLAKGISINVEVQEVGFDSFLAVKKIKSYLNENPDIKVIVTSGAIAIDAANKAVKEMHKKPGDILLIGQVISPKTIQGIKEGYMPAGVNLELTKSSDLAVIEAFHVVKEDSAPTRRTIDFIEITKTNVSDICHSLVDKGSCH